MLGLVLPPGASGGGVQRLWAEFAQKPLESGRHIQGQTSSGLSQRSSVAQWGCLIFCHLKPEHPLAFLLLPSQPQSRTASGKDLTRKSPEAKAAARMGLQQ